MIDISQYTVKFKITQSLYCPKLLAGNLAHKLRVGCSSPNSGGNDDGSQQEVHDQQVNLEEACEEVQSEGHRTHSSKAEDSVCGALQQLGSYQDLSAARTNQIWVLSQTGILPHENWTAAVRSAAVFAATRHGLVEDDLRGSLVRGNAWL